MQKFTTDTPVVVLEKMLDKLGCELSCVCHGVMQDSCIEIMRPVERPIGTLQL